MTSSFTTRPELAGTFGMVASTHWLASAAGMAVLEHGGNAFDAAVAAGLVLQVVEPHLNGPGGEVPVIGFDAANGETFVLDGQGAGPAAHAVGVRRARPGPGARQRPARRVRARGLRHLDAAAARPWPLPLRAVMEHAIGYAAGGYPVLSAISAGIESVAGLFREHWPSSAAVYLTGGGAGGVPVPGSRFANPGLAATYQRILAEAEAAGPRPGRADRGGPAGLLCRLRRRGHRRLPGRRGGAGRHRHAAPRPARRRRPGRLAGRHRAAGEPRLPRPDRVQDRALGAGPGVPAAAGPAVRASTWRAWTRAAPSSSTPSWSARSSPSPTARPGTATPVHRCPARRPAAQRSYAGERARPDRRHASPELRPGRPAAASRGCPVRDATGPARLRPAAQLARAADQPAPASR